VTVVAAPPSQWKVVIALAFPAALGAQSPAEFTVNDTSVRQGRFEAIAVSRDTILSSYPRAAREVRFRFSINGAENEFPGGTEHTIYLRPHDGRLVTRIYRFGDETEPPPPTPEESATSEDGAARVTFRVDLRAVNDSLNSRGFYEPRLGARINRGELAHVYVVGDPAPLTWEYSALHQGSPLELIDANHDGIYEGTVEIPTEYARPRAPDGRGMWARKLDLSAYPQLTSSQRMQDAIYQLSLEELRQLVRDDGALSAGAKWPGVWTRDVSLSTILSLAIVAPDAAKRSLLAKVDSAGRIIQDTGTGGSWPVSSDRMVWSLAAWEIYAMTGDRAWLRQSYDITRRSAEADLHAVRDSETGLFRGESSFLDWREQSYPRWMQPADIFSSQNLGTNAVHYAAYRTLAKMSRALGASEPRWNHVADSIQRGMTQYLWQGDKGWYGQYRYGRTYLTLSPRAEGLGEALAAVYGAASIDQRTALMRNAPVVAYGTPTFWPYIPGERFYHNATIWPFVTAYWTWAAASAGNTIAVRRGLDDATRSTALFLTNKENMVAATGHYEGTALNSDRQLWSVAGTLASTYRILFGLRLEDDCISFHPMIPPAYRGERTLSGVRYRGATLTITVRGFGDSVGEAKLDGRAISRVEIPETATGAHALVLTMNGEWPATAANVVPSRFAPATPRVRLVGGALVWDTVPGAAWYAVYEDGVRRRTTAVARAPIAAGTGRLEYQVSATNAAGDESFLSEPLRLTNEAIEMRVKPAGAELARKYAGFSGGGYAPLTLEKNLDVRVLVRVKSAGSYAIDVRYANGNGPVNTEDKVAIRTLLLDGDTVGVVVMPQRGAGNWTDWGWSDVLRARLTAGAHMLTVKYTPLDANMNRHENTALLDFVRLTRLANLDGGSR
jgi:Bacterial alpha-L-rhamnosidase 6 hairpin glycosidase domain